ncbi:MAG TPA: hypothetical protein VGK93_07020 [Candidatus Eisenbacteria bacterium]|jgi:hypothetical protein
MIQIKVSTNSARVLLGLRKGQKRFSYALSNALNRTADAVQREERAQLERGFLVRKEFVRRQVAVIKPRATPFRLNTTVAVGQRERLLLPHYEEGGERTGFVGQNVAIPVGARPSPRSSIPPRFWFQRLFPSTTAGRSRRGAIRSYIVPKVGVFQQQPGKLRSTLLYLFRRTVRLPAKLRWLSLARTVVRREWAPNLRREVEETWRRNVPER